MARLTTRLPDSLHDTQDRLAEQRARFEELRSRVTPDQAEAALQELLAAREPDPSQS